MIPVNDQSELQYWMFTWRDILELDHWSIVAEYVENDDVLGDEYSFGAVYVDLNNQQALVYVLHPSAVDLDKYPMEAKFPHDPEHTLVHELLHIVLEEVINDQPTDHELNAQEKAINQLARVLLSFHSCKRETVEPDPAAPRSLLKSYLPSGEA